MVDYCSDKDFKEFTAFMKAGLDKGKKEYGEAGFIKNDVFIMASEELRDLAVYAFLLSQKLKLVREKFLKEVKEECRVKTDGETNTR